MAAARLENKRNQLESSGCIHILNVCCDQVEAAWADVGFTYTKVSQR